jgi:hypothetical protein
VVEIGNSAFGECTSLIDIEIPKSVRSIGWLAFAWCSNLVEINVNQQNQHYGEMDGVLFDRNKNVLIKFPEGRAGEYAIPSGVAKIDDFAFANSKDLVNISIPESVTDIGNHAFARSGLRTVSIPESIMEIKSGTFELCSSLESVFIPNSVTNIGVAAFQGCTGLSNMTIPDSVAEIGILAFDSCTSLRTLRLGESIWNAGFSAFANCSSLASITIPRSLTVIGASLFENCLSLTNLHLPNTVTSIGRAAFKGCASLKNITIPSSVTQIESGAFANCTSLEGVYFQGSMPYLPDFAVFPNSPGAIAYYLPGTGEWSAVFGDRPAVLWNPEARSDDGRFGVREGQFGFTIHGNPGITVVVEACADLKSPTWVSLGTHVLTDGSSYFNDSEWKGYPQRCYRLRSP